MNGEVGNYIINDKKALYRGKIIGFIERFILFFFAVGGSYSAMAFILAAKGLTRYKEMEKDKKFGEYVLIGTLLSSVMAIICAEITKILLKAI